MNLLPGLCHGIVKLIYLIESINRNKKEDREYYNKLLIGIMIMISLKVWSGCWRDINKFKNEDNKKIGLIQQQVLDNVHLFQKLVIIFLILKLFMKDLMWICKLPNKIRKWCILNHFHFKPETKKQNLITLMSIVVPISHINWQNQKLNISLMINK